jgi:hypothetical protein
VQDKVVQRTTALQVASIAWDNELESREEKYVNCIRRGGDGRKNGIEDGTRRKE